MGQGPDLREVLARINDARAAEVYTSFPARVDAYDAGTKCADLVPMLRRALPTKDGDTIYEDMPVLPNVPIMFPQGDGMSITWALKKGSFVLVHVSMWGTAEWRKTGDLSDPGDLRLHHPANCFAFPGVAPNADLAALPPALPGEIVLDALVAVKFGALAVLHAAVAEAVQAHLAAHATAITTLGGVITVPPPFTNPLTIIAPKVRV